MSDTLLLYRKLKAVCHMTDWPLQSELNNNGFLCESVYLKQRRANLLDFLPPIESQRIISHSNFLILFVLSLSPNQMRDRLPLR